jgi:antitoxin (DNA-binding transcriptional repressor) of toxin-antitoxin stability system
MLSIDIHAALTLDDVLRQVGRGESVELRREGKVVAVIRPAVEEGLDALADVGVKQLATAFPPHEFSDWERAGDGG